MRRVSVAAVLSLMLITARVHAIQEAAIAPAAAIAAGVSCTSVPLDLPEVPRVPLPDEWVRHAQPPQPPPLPAITYDVWDILPAAHATRSMTSAAMTRPHRLPVTVYVGASELDASGRERGALGVGVDLSGRVAANTQLTLSFVNGPADIISALALSALYRPTVRATVTRPRWSVTGGDLTSASHVLAGPVVRADGVGLKVNRRMFVELTAAQPKYFGGGAGGHVVQGRAGFTMPFGTVALLGSHLTRPVDAMSAIGEIRVVNPVSEEEAAELDNLRRLVSRENRVAGFGIETDFKVGAHALLLRAGSLELESHSGTSSGGIASEARYTFNHPRAIVTAYARHAPRSVPGTYVPGDAVSLSGRVPLGRSFVALAQGYSNTSWLVGQPHGVRSQGASSGVQHGTTAHGFSVQANYRELRSAAQPQVTRSVSLRFARPLGPLAFDARTEIGENRRGGIVRPLRTYNARLTLEGGRGSVWVMTSLLHHGFQAARTRADAGGDLTIGRLQVEAGAGFGKGQLLGDLFTAWSSMDIPLPSGMSLLAGVDYVRWAYSASPYLVLLLDEEPGSPWRFTIGVRRRFSLPVN